MDYDLSQISTEKELTDSRAFKIITDEMYNIYEKKNHDYGNSFADSFKKFGLISAVVRIGDKFNRISSLMKKERLINDESIEDTLIDMANYCIMSVIELEKQKIEKERMIS
mgnify:CR=1 FL=1